MYHRSAITLVEPTVPPSGKVAPLEWREIPTASLDALSQEDADALSSRLPCAAPPAAVAVVDVDIAAASRGEMEVNGNRLYRCDTGIAYVPTTIAAAAAAPDGAVGVVSAAADTLDSPDRPQLFVPAVAPTASPLAESAPTDSVLSRNREERAPPVALELLR